MVDNNDLLELQELQHALGYGQPTGDAKTGLHGFLKHVAMAEDTTKLGNLNEEELGQAGNPVRSFKHLATFAGDIMNKPGLQKYFNSNSEIITASSLSRNAKLIGLAVVSKRQVEDVTKPHKVNKGLFKKKETNPNQELEG